MPPVWYEMQGQTVSGTTATKKWLLRGVDPEDDAADVDALAKAFVPQFWAGLNRQLPIPTVEIATGLWEVTGNYAPAAGRETVAPGGSSPGPPPPPVPGETDPLGPEFSFSTGGGRKHVKQSDTTLQAVRAGGGTPRNFHNLIGVNPETGEVAGADIIAPSFHWGYRTYFPELPHNYLTVLRELTGTINVEPFFGHEHSECLLESVTGQSKLGGGFDVSFGFEGGFTREIVIGQGDNEIVLEDVCPFSVVWTTTRRVTETVGGEPVKVIKPYEAYEEQVYPHGEFSRLGIGGSPPPPPPPPP
jgi:hypothetical protein